MSCDRKWRRKDWQHDATYYTNGHAEDRVIAPDGYGHSPKTGFRRASAVQAESRLEVISGRNRKLRKGHCGERLANVTITSLAGASLFGPEDVPVSTTIASLKARLRKDRPGSAVKLVCDLRELMDDDWLPLGPDAANNKLSLTAILSKAYSVVAWGEAAYGGNQPFGLHDDVLDLFATSGAFAAIKVSGAVVAWGHPAYGGDTGHAARLLTNSVVSIVSGQNAFVALRKDGSAVPWGNARLGGKASGLAAKKLASGIVSVQSSGEAFAALKENGEVVTWGQDVSGGDSTIVSGDLAGGIVKVYSTRGAFAAVTSEDRVITWGNRNTGGCSAPVSEQLASGVKEIFSNTTAFVALKAGGKVVAWGNERCGGHLGALENDLSTDVIAIYSSGAAFAALKADGAVITWGQPGEASAAAELMARGGIATKINGQAVAMVLANGEVVTRGDARSGGDCQLVAHALQGGVTALASTAGAFAALKESGAVITWGRASPHNHGGDSSNVASQLQHGVLKVLGTQSAFAVLRDISA